MEFKKIFGGLKNKQEKTGNVEVMEAGDERKMEGLNEETEKEVKETIELTKPENIIKLQPEKRKLVVDKIKAVLLIGIAAGIVVAAQNFGALDKITEMTGPASKQAVMEGAGVLIATLSAIGIGIRNIYKSLKPEKI